MTDTPESKTPDPVRSIRLPQELINLIDRFADDEDRSFSSVVRQACDEMVSSRTPLVVFPESEFGGRTTYQATVRWQMPGFDGDPDKDEPNTEHVIDRMMTEICRVIRTYGADDRIEVDGPIGVFPMALRSMTSFPPNTAIPTRIMSEPQPTELVYVRDVVKGNRILENGDEYIVTDVLHDEGDHSKITFSRLGLSHFPKGETGYNLVRGDHESVNRIIPAPGPLPEGAPEWMQRLVNDTASVPA